MYEYKTKHGEDYDVPGFGRTVNGRITTDRILENPNFELVTDNQQPTPAPGHVNGVVPQNAQPMPQAPLEVTPPITRVEESENI